MRLSFKEGVEIVSTDDHPFWVINKGWSSLNPKNSMRYSNVGSVEQIELGDEFKGIGKDGELITVTLTKIKQVHNTMETYPLSALDNNDNFFANGLLVAIEVAEESEK